MKFFLSLVILFSVPIYLYAINSSITIITAKVKSFNGGKVFFENKDYKFIAPREIIPKEALKSTLNHSFRFSFTEGQYKKIQRLKKH